MKTTHLKRIFLMLMLISTFGIATTHAQTKKKVHAHKVHKIKKTTSNDGDTYNGHKIYTGPRGGRYYINSNGNKTYI